MDTSDIPFFTQAEPKEFRWPVRVPVPGDGKYSFVEFTAVFKYLNDAAVDALLAAPKAAAPGEAVPPARSDREIAAEILLGVEDIKRADGSAVPSSPELVATVISMDRAAPVTVGVYLAARRGLAAEKNS